MKNLNILFTIFFSALILSSCNISSLMIEERESPYDFDTTVATIQNRAAEKGWLVPKVYNFQATMIKYNKPDPGKI